MQIEAHLSFNGNCEEAFTFYQSVFGGEITAMMRHEGTPAAEHVPADWQDKIMHAYLRIGDTGFMGADAPPQYQTKPQGFCVAIAVETAEEAQKLWDGLSEGAESIQMPLEETFWSPKFGMLIDRFGTPWMINTLMADCGPQEA